MKYQWGKNMRRDSSYFAHVVIDHRPWPSWLPMSWEGLPGSPKKPFPDHLKPFSHPLRSMHSLGELCFQPRAAGPRRVPDRSEARPSQPSCRHWGPACWPDAHCCGHGTEEKLCIWLLSWFLKSLLEHECLCAPMRWLGADGSRASLGNLSMGALVDRSTSQEARGTHVSALPLASRSGTRAQDRVSRSCAVRLRWLWGFAETPKMKRHRGLVLQWARGCSGRPCMDCAQRAWGVGRPLLPCSCPVRVFRLAIPELEPL